MKPESIRLPGIDAATDSPNVKLIERLALVLESTPSRLHLHRTPCGLH